MKYMLTGIELDVRWIGQSFGLQPLSNHRPLYCKIGVATNPKSPNQLVVAPVCFQPFSLRLLLGKQ